MSDEDTHRVADVIRLADEGAAALPGADASPEAQRTGREKLVTAVKLVQQACLTPEGALAGFLASGLSPEDQETLRSRLRELENLPIEDPVSGDAAQARAARFLAGIGEVVTRHPKAPKPPRLKDVGFIRGWLKERARYWQQVEIGGVAVKARGRWYNLALRILLRGESARGGADGIIARDDNLLTYRVSMGGLPTMTCVQLLDVDILNLGIHDLPPIALECPPGTPYANWLEIDVRVYPDTYNLGRMRGLEAHRLGNHVAYLPTSTTLQDLDEQFRAKGGDAGLRRGLAMFGFSYDDITMRETRVRFLAPIPAWILSARPTEDRKKVHVVVRAGENVERERLRVTLEPTEDTPAHLRSSAPALTELTETSRADCMLTLGAFLTPTTPGYHRVLLSHEVEGALVDEGVSVPPPLTIHPRYLAHAGLRKPNELESHLKGLPPAAFEPAVASLLAWLGYSAIWVDQKIEGVPKSQEPVDVIAFSSDDSLVLAVEATTDDLSTTKVDKLIARRNAIAE